MPPHNIDSLPEAPLRLTMEAPPKSEYVKRKCSVGELTLRIYRHGASGPAIETIRTTYRQAVEEKGYEGFSPEYDRQFDPAATYFSVRDAGTLVATARMVSKSEETPLPLEQARVEGTSLSLRAPREAMEITTFWFSSRQSLKAIVMGLADYTLKSGQEPVYATYDRKMEGLRSTYVQTLTLSEPAAELSICHPGYERNGETVRWGVLRINQSGARALVRDGPVDLGTLDASDRNVP